MPSETYGALGSMMTLSWTVLTLRRSRESTRGLPGGSSFITTFATLRNNTRGDIVPCGRSPTSDDHLFASFSGCLQSSFSCLAPSTLPGVSTTPPNGCRIPKRLPPQLRKRGSALLTASSSVRQHSRVVRPQRLYGSTDGPPFGQPSRRGRAWRFLVSLRGSWGFVLLDGNDQPTGSPSGSTLRLDR